MKTAILIIIGIFFYSQGFSQLNKDSERALKRAIGYDLDGFKIWSYPTNNFGVGTSCLRRWNPQGNMLCDMVKCLGLEGLPENSNDWKSVKGKAFFGQGGQIVMNDSITKIYGIGMLLPKILKVLNINIGISSNNTKSVSVTIDSAVKRFLDYDSFATHILTQPRNSRIRQAFERRKMVVATADFVLLNFSVEVTPKDSFGVSLSAKIDSILKINDKITLNKDSLGISISRQRTGSFLMTSTKPVVFAVFVRKQNQLAVHEGTKDFSGWDIVSESEIIDPTLNEQ